MAAEQDATGPTDLTLAQIEDRAEDFLNDGDYYRDKNDLRRAIVAFNEAAALVPQESRVYYWRGQTYEDLGDFSMALADFDVLVQMAEQEYAKDPDYPSDIGRALLFRGRTHYQLGNYAAAIADLERAINVLANWGSPIIRELPISDSGEAKQWLGRAKLALGH